MFERWYFLMIHSRDWLLTGWFLMTAFACGCGSGPHSNHPTGKIVAAVTYDGQPVTTGIVNFSNSQTGLGGAGPLSQDGTATINSVPTGEYLVTVTPPAPPQDDPNPKPVEYPNLPKKFRSESTSTLKATVTTGVNELKFELKK